MKSMPEEDIDYQQDVNNLKRVWQETKELNKQQQKQAFKKSQAATQTKSLNDTKSNINKESKTKVILSEQVMKNTVRNPRSKPGQVIEVVTNPIVISSDKIKNERNNTAPEHFIMTNPENQNLVEVEAFKRKIADQDYELSLLRVSNTHHEDRIRRLEQTILKKDQMIESLSNRQRQLANKLSQLNSKDFNFSYGKVEYQNYRHDSRRLLKLLQSTNEYAKFADFALDDNGVRFLTNLNLNVKTKMDAPSNKSSFHFCTCNKEFIPEPFLWVPEKIYDYGKEFIKNRNGELTQAQLQLLLYDLNKIWRQRQKRIVNHVNALKANEIGKYKRRLKDMSVERQKTKYMAPIE